MTFFNKTSIALSAIALCQALPVAAQTIVTMEAEGMTLSSYAVENANRIKLTASSGSAQKAFSGASGIYNMQVFVETETDGQPTLSVYKGSTLLRDYTYPLGSAITSFPINNVTLQSGETIRLVGRTNAGAMARVDKIVLTRIGNIPTAPVTTTPTAPVTTTPTAPVTTTPIIGGAVASVKPVTIEAEGMTLSSYAVENGNRIKLTAASGSAQKGFSGVTGTYNMQVFVETESDGRPTISVYKGATHLRDYTYPLGSAITSFPVNNVALKSGDTIRLVGRTNGGAMARVDKIVLSPVNPPTTPTTPTTPVPTTPPSSTAACANPSGGYEGYGRNTTGGAGKPIYRVTNLNDSGAGSLRDALSQGNRCVVFDVGGTISLSGYVLVRGANLTIDGLTAPAPGITVRNQGLIMQGSSGAGNVVVRGIRLRGTPTGEDQVRIYNASNIVVDRVSLSAFADGAIDVTENSHDVTIQYSIFGTGGEAMDSNMPSMIGYKSSRVSIHHNLYLDGHYRNPFCQYNYGSGPVPAEAVCDIRNNVIWNYGGNGTQVDGYGSANIVNNYYYTTKPMTAAKTIQLGYSGSTYSVHTSGNYSQNGFCLNGVGNRSTPFAVAEPATSDALTAARQVLAQAGARGPRFGLDQEDLNYLGRISLP